MTDEQRRLHQKTIRLQKQIFQHLKTEAHQLLGRSPKSILKYEQEAHRGCHSSHFQRFSRQDLLQKMIRSQVIFIGDFHPFEPAQRQALQLMQDAYHEAPKEEWVLALEILSSEHQERLNQFIQKKGNLSKLPDEIPSLNEWGFPWKNYAPFFFFAQKKGIPLLAINRPKEVFGSFEENELDKRDEWGAALLADYLLEHPSAKILVFYGELHIARKHLPLQLTRWARKKPKVLSIFQDDDKVYWKLAREHKELETEAVRLKKDTYCLLTQPPWAKLHALIAWAEGEELIAEPEIDEFTSSRIHSKSTDSSQAELTHDRDNSDETIEIIPDHLSKIRFYGQTISRFFDLPEASYDDLDLFTLGDTSALLSRIENKSHTKIEAQILSQCVKRGIRFYSPALHIAYMGAPTLSGMAEIASAYLFSENRPQINSKLNHSNKISFIILQHAFSFLGSLLIHPKRPLDTTLAKKNSASRSQKYLHTRTEGFQLGSLIGNQVLSGKKPWSHFQSYFFTQLDPCISLAELKTYLTKDPAELV